MGQIKVTLCPIDGLYIIKPAVHGDSRGYFMETYNKCDMEEASQDLTFVQDNQSMSVKGVLRGLHFQKQYPGASWSGPSRAASLMWLLICGRLRNLRQMVWRGAD